MSRRAAAAIALASAALVAAACGSPPPPSAPAPRAPAPPAASAALAAPSAPAEPEEDEEHLDPEQAHREVVAMLARVSTARQLVAKGAVMSRVLGRGALVGQVRAHVAREVPADVIRGQGELLTGLGLLPPTYDYEAGTFELLESQLAGFYEPADRTMYLAADLDGKAAEATLAHELVHALQDQRWDLAPRLAWSKDASDRQSAIQALAEGDATSAMMDVMLAPAGKTALDLSDAAFATEVEASMALSKDTASVPHVMRASLTAPYVDGLVFVHGLRRHGGWARVDAAWTDPPVTTEQLLHPDKYASREPAQILPENPPPPGEGWQVAYDDVFGEQGLRIALADWVPRRVAEVAAAGWGGDRATLFRRGTGEDAEWAIAWHLRFDARPGGAGDQEGREAYRAAAAAFHAVGDGGGAPVCAERPVGGRWALGRRGRDVALVVSAYRHRRGGIDPVGDCATAIAWDAAVLAAPARPR